MFCSKCGNQIPDDSRLCCYCGAPVAVPEPVPAAGVPEIQAENKPKKKLWIRICAIATAVALLVSLGLFLYLNVFTVELWVLTAEYYEVPEEHREKLGERLLLCSYEYDKDGNLIEKWDASHTAFSGDPELGQLVTYEYNEYGDCISEEVDNSKISEDRVLGNVVWEYDYDYDGKLKTEKYQIREREETLRATYEYDGNKLYRIISGDMDSNVYSYREFDEKGNLVEYCEHYYSEEVIDIRKFEYSYDKKGRLVGIERYYEDETGTSSIELEFCYDRKGNLECVVFLNADGEETGRFEYNVDKHGNVISLDTDDNNSRYTYEYKKIRVSKKQAIKLVQENSRIEQVAVWSGIPDAFMYRIEK